MKFITSTDPANPQPIYTAIFGIYDEILKIVAGNQINCANVGYYSGLLLSETLEAKVESTVADFEVDRWSAPSN